MKRRIFLLSGSSSVALAMTGCGGGGSAGDTTLSQAGTAATTNVPLALLQTGTTTATSTIAYPFGSRRVPYAAGIRPSVSLATMDGILTAQYDAWKAAAVVNVPGITGGKAVKFSDPNYIAVSEGSGYGMLIAVLFAGHDAGAQALFDGLLTTVRARPAYAMTPSNASGAYLMDWRLNANGTSGGSGWNAMDGDLDIAMALLMADQQWGSTGSWNYKQQALNTIAALKYFSFKPDGTSKGLANSTTSRTSDYMFGHFRAFQKATGDSFWSTVIDRSYYLANLMQTSYSSAGLMPDFIVNTGGELKAGSGPYPSPGGWGLGDGNYDSGKFWWNACRNPWRFSSDYLLSGDARTKQLTAGLINFFKKAAGSSGDVTQIGTGYALDGTRLAWTSGWNAAAFMGPIMAGACVDSSYQAFLDAMWTWNVGHRDIGYYDGEIQLLSLVVASGNWWTPGVSSTATTTPTTTATTTTAATTAATGNILVNGDFSSGLTNWNNWGNSQVVGGALQVGTAAGGVGQNISTTQLTAGTKYQLTGTANITTAAEGVFVGIGIKDSAGTALVNQTQLVSSLTPVGVSISFTAPQGAASCTVFVWKNANGAIGVVDNLALAAVAATTTTTTTQPTTTQPAPTPVASANILANGDFSSGLTNWNNWGNSQVVGGALQVGTAAGGLGQNISTTKLTAGTKYQLTGTANITTAAEGVFVGIGITNSAGTALVDQRQLVSSLTPVGVSISFTAPQGAANCTVFVWKNANGAIGVVDNLALVAVA